MFKIFTILAISFWLFLTVSPPQKKFYFSPQKKESLLKAICEGNKSFVSQKLKNDLKILGLLHLLTPSGLHFSSFLCFLAPLFGLVRSKKVSLLLKSLIFISPFFFLTKMYSLKRVAFYKLLKIYLPIKHINSFHLFSITFFVDYLWGSYSQSPYSFIYSFLFFGLVITSWDENSFSNSLFLNLYIGQIFISLIQGSPFYILGPFLGIIITFIFSITFPYLLLSYFSFFKFPFTDFLIELLKSSIQVSSDLATSVPSFLPSWGLIFFLILWKKYHGFILLFIFLCFPQNITNLPFQGYLKEIKEKKEINEITIPALRKKISKRGQGYGFSYKGKRCYTKFTLNGIHTKCVQKTNRPKAF